MNDKENALMKLEEQSALKWECMNEVVQGMSIWEEE